MRALLVAALLVAGGTAIPRTGRALANPLPPGAMQVAGGGAYGTGVDASRLGGGYVLGAQASWQPMSTEQRIGWALRWTTLFGKSYGGSAARIDDVLRTVQIDFTAGLRYRPWTTPRRYLTLRAGLELLRSNQEIAPSNDRDFVGPIASVGLDQYILGRFLLSADVRYGMIANGPDQIGLVIAFGFDGP